MSEKERARAVCRILAERYPGTTALDFRDPFTLLVAAVLAAQCTDERVNRVTATLFDRYPDPRSFAEAALPELEKAIHSTGFFRQKAKTLQSCCRELLSRFDGVVPPTLEELTTLPGIGRKTANLVLGNSLGVPGIFVDTHVKRVSHRLGLSSRTHPDKIESDLAALLPPRDHVAFSNNLTHLGREFCTARTPRCPNCVLRSLCPRIGV